MARHSGSKVPDIIKAISDEDIPSVIQFVKSKPADINAKYGEHGRTSLMYACEHGNMDIVKTLLENRANVNIADDMNQETALHLVARMGHCLCSKLLIRFGAKVNVQTLNGQTPLHQAVCEKHEDIVEVLLQVGANVNIKNSRDNTCLHWAALYQNIKIASLLMQHSPDLSLKNRSGKTPLDIACEKKNSELLSILEGKEKPAVPYADLKDNYITPTRVGSSKPQPMAHNIKDEYFTMGNTSKSPSQTHMPMPSDKDEDDYLVPIGRDTTDGLPAEHDESSSGEKQNYYSKETLVKQVVPSPPNQPSVPMRNRKFGQQGSCKETQSVSPVLLDQTVREDASGVQRSSESQKIQMLERDVKELQQKLMEKQESEEVKVNFMKRVESLEMKVNQYTDMYSSEAEKLRRSSDETTAHMKAQFEPGYQSLASAEQVKEMSRRLTKLESQVQDMYVTVPSGNRNLNDRRAAYPNRIFEVIKKRHGDILEQLDLFPHLDYLYQEDVLSHDQYEEITALPAGTKSKIRKLMTVLHAMSPVRWVYVFLCSLKNQPATKHLAIEIEKQARGNTSNA